LCILRFLTNHGAFVIVLSDKIQLFTTMYKDYNDTIESVILYNTTGI